MESLPSVPAVAWIAFMSFVVAMLAFDLFVLHRKAREVSLREAAGWSGAWIVMAVVFGAILWGWRGGSSAEAYYTGYLIEKMLSVDNVFAFSIIFSSFAIPLRYRHRVLMYGMIGALVLRGGFIAGGVALIDGFHPTIYILGVLLLVTALRMATPRGTTAQIGDYRTLRVLRRVAPVTDDLQKQRFVVRNGGRRLITPLMVVLVLIEVSDVVFAIDSIPAVLAVSRELAAC